MKFHKLEAYLVSSKSSKEYKKSLNSRSVVKQLGDGNIEPSSWKSVCNSISKTHIVQLTDSVNPTLLKK